MGRIKSALIKRTAKALLKHDNFSENFEENKRILGNSLPSKSIRNKVAGYIARLNKMNAKQQLG
ncbi:30S ribosomal protein S17e [Candidatus Pacearchaeota archaeon]|nr:30S ribosomal protein S17e [Candidatus Pacearchaeota archaeon]